MMITAERLVRRLAVIGVCICLVSGCNDASPTVPISFEPNHVYALRLGTSEGVELSQAVQDVHWALERVFGTCDQPELPQTWREDPEIARLIVPEHLQYSAGPIDGNPPQRGLFRAFCAQCHGDSGTGRGQSVLSQNPYPRDFRKGVFKFKTTERNGKPSREDLRQTIRGGLAGTGMSAFPQLNDTQVEALISHVIFLSIRGEVERKLLEDAAFELDLEAGERFIASEWEADPQKKENFDASLDLVNELARNILDDWLSTESQLAKTELPSEFSLVKVKPEMPGKWEELSSGITESIERGAKLFASPAGGCTGCHGPAGRGDGRTGDFDDWTKEWTINIGIEPGSYEQTEPFLLLGALPPRPIAPRNLRDGVFRNGTAAERLFLRIKHGIPGTPMPALSIESDPAIAGIHDSDIWDLVNFVRWLSHDINAPGLVQPAPSGTGHSNSAR